MKKHMIIGIVFFLLVASLVLTSHGRNNMNLDFAEILASENIDDLSLTIYYVSFNMFTPWPWRLKDLIEMRDGKIIVSGSELEETIDLIKQINSDILIQEQGEPWAPYFRLYYVLESKENGRLFDVAMWGIRGGIVFNGVEVEEHYIFYDIVIPFLPEEIAELMRRGRDVLAYGSE